MTWEELKSKIMDYVNSRSEEPEAADIDILEAVADYVPEVATDEAEIEARIAAAVEETDRAWMKRYKDRFYSEDETEEPEITEPEVITNDPEEEVEKSILDYEW